jgi:hypothetical protein
MDPAVLRSSRHYGVKAIQICARSCQSSWPCCRRALVAVSGAFKTGLQIRPQQGAGAAGTLGAHEPVHQCSTNSGVPKRWPRKCPTGSRVCGLCSCAAWAAYILVHPWRTVGIVKPSADPLTQTGQLGRQSGESSEALVVHLPESLNSLLLREDQWSGAVWICKPVCHSYSCRKCAHHWQ